MIFSYRNGIIVNFTKFVLLKRKCSGDKIIIFSLFFFKKTSFLYICFLFILGIFIILYLSCLLHFFICIFCNIFLVFLFFSLHFFIKILFLFFTLWIFNTLYLIYLYHSFYSYLYYFVKIFPYTLFLKNYYTKTKEIVFHYSNCYIVPIFYYIKN